MAIKTFEDYINNKNRAAARDANGGSGSNFPERKVGYLKGLLSNDKDSILVRFDYDSQKDFQIVTVHSVKAVAASGKTYTRYISCLRGPKEPISVCPFCSSTDESISSVKNKMFVKMVVYTVDNNGKTSAEAHCWDRPAKISEEILRAYKDGIDDGFYAEGTPIRDVVFQITRSGAKGSRDTVYHIKAKNPNVYRPEVYVKDFSAFEGFDAGHHSYSVKTAEDMSKYLETGEFPAFKKEGAATAEAAPAKAAEATPVAPATPVASEPAPATVHAAVAAPVEEAPASADRPRRYNTLF